MNDQFNYSFNRKYREEELKNYMRQRELFFLQEQQKYAARWAKGEPIDGGVLIADPEPTPDDQKLLPKPE